VNTASRDNVTEHYFVPVYVGVTLALCRKWPIEKHSVSKHKSLNDQVYSLKKQTTTNNYKDREKTDKIDSTVRQND